MDLSRFSPDPSKPDEREYLHAKYGLDPSKPIILHVGRLDVDKNVTTLIRAAACAMARGESQLLVVGDGCQRKVLEQLCTNLGITESAHFLGYVDQDGDLPGLYRQATVFATASEIEIQGTVILEALASGVPVVSVRATSMPEFVLDSVNGHLVQPGSVRQMGDCLARLLSSPERAKEMGQAGRELVSKHAISNSIRRHEELYQDLIQESVITQ
jgi:glycosyltransferase involved in cell wall biosynthesis